MVKQQQFRYCNKCLEQKLILRVQRFPRLFLSPEDHRFLVEPACGATLAAVYSNIIHKLVQQGRLQNITTVLAIVCGGSMVSTSVMEGWKDEFGL